MVLGIVHFKKPSTIVHLGIIYDVGRFYVYSAYSIYQLSCLSFEICVQKQGHCASYQHSCTSHLSSIPLTGCIEGKPTGNTCFQPCIQRFTANCSHRTLGLKRWDNNRDHAHAAHVSADEQILLKA